MISSEFLLAGDAIFTVQSVTGERYTYRITKSDPEEDIRRAELRNEQPRPTFFVKVLTGPDNESDYTYMGILNVSGRRLIITAKSKFFAVQKPVKVLEWAVGKVLDGGTLPAGYEIHHEGRCGRCGRTLTVPESIESGIGPTCAEIMEGVAA